MVTEPKCTCGNTDHWLSHPHFEWCDRYGLPVLMHYRLADGKTACGRNDAGSNCYIEHVTCRECLEMGTFPAVIVDEITELERVVVW